MDAFSSVLVGDANRNTVLFAQNSTFPVPIASTSKLMTYLLLRECEWNGELHFTDTVTITEEADRISRSADGMISMNAYSTVPFQELVEGMLLCSSNEAAASLAAYATGSTEIFVEHMNERARELSLFSARFYTPHGLPVTRDGQTHNLVLVILGAETPDLRGQAGEILLRWAQDYYTVHPFRDSQN